MQPHLGSVVWCMINIAWLGLKFLEILRDLWVKMYNLCKVFKTNQLAVLTVKSDLYPHMIN
jgi:hypothetical protein